VLTRSLATHSEQLQFVAGQLGDAVDFLCYHRPISDTAADSDNDDEDLI